ncbi:DUF998 domain-containing protein [Microbacterium aquimaris]|uniref:DUF998 domain-containing protein n=1 Tax=Microbacterium aquimaris TaxID=459816 RepID=UPI002AD36BB3|nr:DUF998 domain-containing protein [Microbacterium aquimaris]MDZ8276471.1 DUF998 domain-containing protein [Microbacterium aquimaris]
MAVLAIGVLTAILTTKDASWWTLHFSQLGTIGDFSARTFNTTVIVSGSILAAYGVVIGMTLPATTGRHTRRGLRGSLITAGLAMTVVGLIPIPVSVVMHDLAASTLGLSFLSLVAWSLGLPGLPRRFRHATLLFVIVLATGIVVLTAGLITLALFEFTAFSVVGYWLISLPRALRRQAERSASESHPSVEPTEAPQVATVSEPRGTRAVQPRRRHRMVRAVRPARRIETAASPTAERPVVHAGALGSTRPALHIPRVGPITQSVAATAPGAHRRVAGGRPAGQMGVVRAGHRRTRTHADDHEATAVPM